MSKEVLQALIQLFALVPFHNKDNKRRQEIVKHFLRHQLTRKQVSKFYDIYEYYYQKHASKLYKKKQQDNEAVTLSANSVKALMICEKINKELTHYQKVLVIIEFIRFLNIEDIVNEYEKDFIFTIAQSLNIEDEEIKDLEYFIISKTPEVQDKPSYLIIDNQEYNSYEYAKHFKRESLEGKLIIHKVNSANLYLLKVSNDASVSINDKNLKHRFIYILAPGNSIRNDVIAPIFYSDIIKVFNDEDLDTHVSFQVKDLTYVFPNNNIGLHTLNFSFSSGNLVGIMGDSGAGKSTLLNIMCGSYKPTSGSVKINGIDIHTELDKAKGAIGYVSQDDLLIENLTVYDNLYYNAKLICGNISPYEIKRRILTLLSSLGLNQIRNMKVGSPLDKKISGGQRKRLNIALELLREPSVLFLDEPTSGLSSKDSDNIIELLKELTNKGKLVFVVIHQPSSNIFKMFNKLLVLDNGGYLIYDGDPVESINYFRNSINHANKTESECRLCGNVNPEQVLDIVNSELVDQRGNYTNRRKYEPSEWYDKFNKVRQPEEVEIKSSHLPVSIFKIPNRLKQFWVFVTRDIKSKLSDAQYVIINLLEVQVLAFFLAGIIKYYNIDSLANDGYVFLNNPNVVVYIIMVVIIALFIGLTVSAEEIISDRKILKREKLLNLSRLSYICSKVFILGVLSAIQTFLLTIIGNSIIEIQGMFFEYWIMLFSVSIFANILGLNISDALKQAVNVYILVPFLIIPQIILSGVFISYDNLNPKFSNPEKVPFYGELITARWAFEGLVTKQFMDNKYEKQFFVYDKLKSQASYYKEYWTPALLSKLNYCVKNIDNKEHKETVEQYLRLVKNEIVNHKENGVIHVKYDYVDKLNPDSFDENIYNFTRKYLMDLKKGYRKLYNKTDDANDKKIKLLTKTETDKELFNKTKENYANLQLEQFVRNNNNMFTNKIIVYKDHLIQKTDPIFKKPEKGFFNAHFMSPYKQIGNIKVPTFIFDLIIIWIFNILLFVTLYFRLLKKLLNKFSNLTNTFNPNYTVEVNG